MSEIFKQILAQQKKYSVQYIQFIHMQQLAIRNNTYHSLKQTTSNVVQYIALSFTREWILILLKLQYSWLFSLCTSNILFQLLIQSFSWLFIFKIIANSNHAVFYCSIASIASIEILSNFSFLSQFFPVRFHCSTFKFSLE